MSCEDKSTTAPSTSAKVAAAEMLNSSSTSCMSSGIESVQAINRQSEKFNGPVAILWDIENCPVPSDVRPEDVAGNIRMALRVHPIIKGAVTMFSAYGDFNAFPRRLREGCQRTGVKLVDVPSGRKDSADKAILIDMFLFALDNKPPSSIMLISGDVDFAPALHILGQRGYTIILVIPSGVGVSSALSNAGRFVWDWPSVARGEGFVPPKTCIHHGLDLSSYVMSCSSGDNTNLQNDEEAIVYRGTFQSEYGAQASNQAYFYNSVHVTTEPSRTSQSANEYCRNNLIAGPYSTSSRSQSLPAVSGESLIREQNAMQEQGWWVRPGDLQGLKGQIVRLLEISGGSLPLVRVPSEYLKFLGRPLYMSEYGVHKLVDLIKKMADSLVVFRKGQKKMLCLRYAADRHFKKCPSQPAMVREDNKGKGVDEIANTSVCPHLARSSDEFSDSEKNDESLVHGPYEFEEQLETLRQEVQELLVCYSCPVPLNTFHSLYEQRYKKAMDYRSVGAISLEELIDKLKDVVELHEDQGSKKKFVISTFIS